MAGRSEIDRQNRGRHTQPDDRSEPHPDRQPHVFATPLGPTGDDPTGRPLSRQMSDRVPADEAGEHRQGPANGSTHYRHTEDGQGGGGGHGQDETRCATPRRFAADEEHGGQESQYRCDADGDERAETSHHVAVMARAVGNGVGGSVEQRTDGHDESGYAMGSPRRWHLVAVTTVLVWSIWACEHGSGSFGRRGGWIVVVIAAVVAARNVLRGVRHVGRSLARALLVVIVLVLGGWRSSNEWRRFDRVDFGDVSSVATLVSDPTPIGRGLSVVVAIDGDRFESIVYGRHAWTIADLERGESVWVVGRTRESSPERRRRSQIRHVVGVLEVESFVEPVGGASRRSRAIDRSANDVRDVMARGASTMSRDDAALFAGLVYGDDSAQSRDTIERFRASGLAHLTAVSGQNVGYLLTVLSPLLRRRDRWTRLAITAVALVWFAVLTRVEPSVVRAAGMAAISVGASTFGWRPRAIDVLSTCVIVFLIVDPFLAWSVGWWLSTAGTAGLVLLTVPIHRHLRSENGGRNRVADWVAPTIAAQLGVLPVLIAVFGWPNALSLPANLLAAPVAGFVMLVGIPTALVAGLVPSIAGGIMTMPTVAVRWVDGVARTSSAIDPPLAIDVMVAFASPLVVLAIGRSRRRSCASLG